jgi:hypothetical protein
MSLRLIQGGRVPDLGAELPGLRIEGAAEIGTMAGGIRAGA